MISPRLDRDYASAVTDASRSVLLEVMTVLGEYRDALVLIGGWGPYFLLPQTPAAAGFGSQGQPFRHIGSIDIDLAVNPERITGEEYKTIVRLLQERGYTLDPELKYRLNRAVPGLPSPIGIDFLTTQPPLGQGKAHRHRKVQDGLPARATEHLEMALQWNEPLNLEGDLPESGGRSNVTLCLASLPAMFGLKGLALGARYKEKDAYDIYAMARYFGSGIEDVVSRLKPNLGNAGLQKGLGSIREKFKSDKDAGPSWVANFFSTAQEAERARIRQDAYLTMDRVLKSCGL
ncbi:MAG TPA: hypothetical protein DEB40_05930 [Elusimicrobia bacterium]|nr:hypothetical protein [Elusimicrobiota bacterium]HBT61265.1 hypothetical protein [Elusimicrobiota bacterium]